MAYGKKTPVKVNGKTVRYTQRINKTTTYNYNKHGQRTSKTVRY